MAKSLRSKWRRKCRAIKRERYGVKELARLKKTLGMDENAPTDIEMPEISEIANVVSIDTLKAKSKSADEEETTMEDGSPRIFNKKTMLDQHGNYPVWMNKRQILKHKKGRAKAKKSTVKTSKRLTRRQKKAKQQKQTT